jgi:hypothetical protein
MPCKEAEMLFAQGGKVEQATSLHELPQREDEMQHRNEGDTG